MVGKNDVIRLSSMKKHRNFLKIVLLLFSLIISKNIYGADPEFPEEQTSTSEGSFLEITNAEVGIFFRPEFNLNLYYSWDIAVIGMLELNDRLVLRSGIALGQSWANAIVSAHASAKYRLPFFDHFPLSLKTAYIYNGLPAYKTHVHTIIPLAVFTWRHFEASLGCRFRFLYFAGNHALSEHIFAGKVTVNIYKTDDVLIGIRAANFDDFAASNIDFAAVTLFNRFRISDFVSISNEMKLELTGYIFDFSFMVYGLSYRAGVIFKW